MTIYCTGCKNNVEARLTNGLERYPHRQDLHDIPFWTCDKCKSWVGCHYKTDRPTRPLGYLATPQILNARKKIHALLDPLWKSKRIKRGQAYAYVSNRIGKTYHNGEIKTLDEARQIYKIVEELHNKLLEEENDWST